jgi:hypothetical protein
MTRREFIVSLQKAGKTDPEIVAALLKGDVEAGVKPVKGKTPEASAKFAKLILGRIKKTL